MTKRDWRQIFRARTSHIEASAADLEFAAPRAREQRIDNGLWPYSDQYATLVGEGNRRPPPEFGTPTLIWQMGIWPRHEQGKSPAAEGARKNLDKNDDPERRRAAEAKLFDGDNVAFFDELSNFLLKIQKRGRVSGAPLTALKYEPVARLPGTEGDVFSFSFGKPQSASFTLWWRDGEGPNDRPDEPSPQHLRVRVLAQGHQDHATLAFFIDVAKPWGGEYMLDWPKEPGDRRGKIMRYIDFIRSMASDQIARGNIELDRFPERDIDAETAKQLLEINEYLYDGVWREFMAAFDIVPWPDAQDPAAGKSTLLGERFSEYRSLVIGYDAIPTPHNVDRAETAAGLKTKFASKRPKPPVKSSSGTVGLGGYPIFDAEAGEPNAVVKGMWPFIRRMSYRADERDTVACGILGWRALFIAPMGASVSAYERDESPGPDFDVAGGHLPGAPPTVNGAQANRPNRQLFITKGEPHRLQLGRFVERVTAAENARLFALRNWETIRNASVHIRVLGHELDGVLTYWGKRRAEIDADFRRELQKLTNATDETIEEVYGSAYMGEVPGDSQRDLTVKRIAKMTALIAHTESNLIAIGAQLDKIGSDGAGRLLYLLNRSAQFTKEFERILDMIEVRDIPTWTDYQRFVERGLRPTFDVIVGTKERLVGLRERLQSITDIVQTSALIVEAEATRSNTQILEKIAGRWYWLNRSIWVLVITTLFGILTSDLFANFVDWMMKTPP